MAHGRAKGFTLVEILVTLAMMGTIMAALYGSYQAVVRARETLGPTYRQTQRVAWMLHRLRYFLRGVYVTSWDTTHDTAVGDSTQGILPPDDFAVDSGTSHTDLDFLCAVAAPHTERCQLQRVYVRWTRSNGRVDMATTSAFFAEAEDVEAGLSWQCLLEGVEGFDVALLESGQWFDTWPRGEESTLPEAIRISVTIQTDKGRSKSWGVVVSPAVPPSKRRIERAL